MLIFFNPESYLRLSRSKQLPWRKVDGPMWTIGSGRVVEADVVTRPTFALLLAHSCSTCALLLHFFWPIFALLLNYSCSYCHIFAISLFVCSCVWIVSSCIFWILGTMCHLWVPVLVVFSLFLQIQVEYRLYYLAHFGQWVLGGFWELMYCHAYPPFKRDHVTQG